MKYYSPLRYPGGKGKLLNTIKELYKVNALQDHIYAEPFAGGASIAIGLLMEEFTPKVIINDIDYHIYAFWYSILNNTEEFCRLISDTSISIRMWEKQKYIFNDFINQDIFLVGFSTFFLNRTNHSGILNGGIIGGANQKGKWKINARFNKKDLMNRIEKIALYKDRISIMNYDANDLLTKLNKEKDKLFLFIDPPYFVNGKDLYLNFFKNNDHLRLSKKILKLNKDWIVTYDNVPEINTMYNKSSRREFSLSYSARTRKFGKEVMFASKRIVLPEILVV